MQRIGIIGAGRFGMVLAQSLAERGADVLLMDADRDKINRVSSSISKAVRGDATDADALTEAGFGECDSVVVAIGGSMEASILATIMLKEMNIREIVARAESDIHGKVLERVGADRVVHPNRDMARRVARSIWAPTVLDYFQISDGVSIMEVIAPKRFIGKSLAESKIRNELGVTVLALRRAPDADGKRTRIVTPTGNDVIEEGDSLTVFGDDKHLRKLERLGS